jgi:hypothetical protein
MPCWRGDYLPLGFHAQAIDKLPRTKAMTTV